MRVPPLSSLFFSLLALVLVTQPGSALAAMSSTNYQIDFDSFSFGGQNNGASTSYLLRDGTGTSFGSSMAVSSSSYTLNPGLRGGLQEPFVQFSLLVPTLSSEVAVTAQGSTNVYTLASTTGYTVGDTVMLIGNVSSSPSYRIGTITDITGSDVTLSIVNTDGDYDSLTIDGTDDVAYVLTTGSSIPLGLLDDGFVTNAYVVMRMGAFNAQGGTVFVYEDTDLTDGSNTIADVADGAVTAGSSEYGGRSSDTSLANSTFDTQDTAFSTSLQEVMTRSAMAPIEYDVLTLKAAISDSQEQGSYSHNLTFVYAGDY